MPCRLVVSLCAALSLTAAPAVADYQLAKVAIAGEAAPGTAGTFANAFLSVSINDDGQVGFVDNVDGASAAWGAFRRGPSGLAAASLAGDTAPGSGGGTYFFPGGFTTVDGAGRLSFASFLSGGSASTGIFADAGGSDVALVVAGQPAPDTGGGSFEGSIVGLNAHAANASGTVAFVDDVVAGNATQGVFTTGSGGFAAVALQGDPAPGGAATYTAFQTPSINAGGDVVFVADLSSGSNDSGLFVAAAGGSSFAIAESGDPAPGTGGGTFDSFLYPVINESGMVGFLANVVGGSATGGVFLYDGGDLIVVAVDGTSTPIGGTFTSVTSTAPVDGLGNVVFSAVVTGGTEAAGLFVYDSVTTAFEPILLSATVAPDSGGRTFDAFGLLAVNERGDVAFQTTLSDGNTALFLAGQPAAVPTLSEFAQVLFGFSTGLAGCAALRRRSLPAEAC